MRVARLSGLALRPRAAPRLRGARCFLGARNPGRRRARVLAATCVASLLWLASVGQATEVDDGLEEPTLEDTGELEIAPPPVVAVLPLSDVEFDPDRPFELIGKSVEPHRRKRLDLRLGESFAGRVVTTPVQVIRGDVTGPTVCLVAGIHGDEVVGIEIVRRLVDVIDPDELRGAVIAMPIANPMGFRRLSRYLPDRRDLNRYFPGRAQGSSASRIAYRIFDSVIRHCQIVVDYHSGSFHRTNLEQVRADLRDPQLFGLSTWFGVPVVVHSEGRIGTLRRAATDVGIQAVLFEAGEPMRFDEPAVEVGVEGTLSMLRRLGMLDPVDTVPRKSEVFHRRHWVRAEEGGIFLSRRKLGDWVEKGDVMGTVTDAFTNESVPIYARETGRIIGRALDQVVIPGIALYHVGTPLPGTDELEELVEPTGEPLLEMDERPE